MLCTRVQPRIHRANRHQTESEQQNATFSISELTQRKTINSEPLLHPSVIFTIKTPLQETKIESEVKADKILSPTLILLVMIQCLI